MSEIVHHVGYETAMSLVRHFGGTALRIPLGKSVWPDEIEAIIGKVATEKMIWAFGGSVLYIPRRYREALLHRNISICLEYEELIQSINATEAVNVLARSHGFSDRNIYLILKGTDPEAVTAERRKRQIAGQESAKRAPAGSVSLEIM